MSEAKEKPESQANPANSSSSALCNAGKEIVGLGAAELSSMGASMVAYAAVDKVAPGLLKSAGAAIGKHLEPYIGSIEKWLGKLSKLSEFKPDMHLPKGVRAANFAKGSIKFVAAFFASIATKIAVRKLWNNQMEVSHEPEAKTGNWFKDNILYRWLNRHDWKVLLWDEGVHLAALLALNRGIPGKTDAAINKIAAFLEKYKKYSFGLISNAEDAKNMAVYASAWEVPNFLGLAAGSGAILHEHLKSKPASFVERLEAEPRKNTTILSNADKTHAEKARETPASETQHFLAS